jgi:hypothetical protein
MFVRIEHLLRTRTYPAPSAATAQLSLAADLSYLSLFWMTRIKRPGSACGGRVKAVVMAGGEGSRLRPITIGRPKPMVPIVNKAVISHIFDLLKHHGITEVVVTLRYMASAIEDFFDDGSSYRHEDHLRRGRGAAGHRRQRQERRAISR